MKNIIRKENYVGLIALLFAFGTMSFKIVDTKMSQQDPLTWYVKVDGVWMYDQIDEDPSITCPGGSQNYCAKGFENDPGPGNVTDETTAEDNRFYAP